MRGFAGEIPENLVKELEGNDAIKSIGELARRLRRTLLESLADGDIE